MLGDQEKEREFHRMNDVIMDLAKIYMRWHDEEQNFGIEESLRREEIHTIQAIGNNEGINITELSRLFNITKPTISDRVRKLSLLNLVEKRNSPGNNKEILLFLTQKGWIAYQDHEEKHHKLYKSFEAYFGDDAALFLDSFMKNLDGFSLFLSKVKEKKEKF